jgi:hypothetical protein
MEVMQSTALLPIARTAQSRQRQLRADAKRQQHGPQRKSGDRKVFQGTQALPVL